MTVSSSDSNSTTRRNWLRACMAMMPSVLGGCAGPGASSFAGGASRKARAQWEFQHYFLASGARFRYHPYGGQGRAWTQEMQWNDSPVGTYTRTLNQLNFTATGTVLVPLSFFFQGHYGEVRIKYSETGSSFGTISAFLTSSTTS